MAGVLLTKNFRLCKIGEKDTKFGFKVDEASLNSVISSEKFQSDMNNRFLFGFISHEIRKEIDDISKAQRLPYVDVALNSGHIANVLYDCHLAKDENGDTSFVGKIDVLDTPKGRDFMAANAAGSKIKLSLSTTAVPANGVWNFKTIRGADFTTLPAFNTEEVPMDFSNGDRLIEGQIANFSLDLEVLDDDANFSSNDEEENFDFAGVRDYIIEHTRNPRQVFKRRHAQVRQYLSGSSPALIKANFEIITQYLREYILQWINKAISNPSGAISLMMGLGLNSILDSEGLKAGRKLQRVLTRIRSALASTGTMTPAMQKELNSSFGILMDSIMRGLLEKAPKAKAALESNNASVSTVA